jgi:hypothetical protein
MAIKVHFMIGLLAFVVFGGRPTISSELLHRCEPPTALVSNSVSWS